MQAQLQSLDLANSQQLRIVLVCNNCGVRTYSSEYLMFFQGIDSRIIANQHRHKCPNCGEAGKYRLFVEAKFGQVLTERADKETNLQEKQAGLDAVKLANGGRKAKNLGNGGHRGYKMRKITAIEAQGEQVVIRLECGHERGIFPYLGRTAEQYATELQQGINPFVMGKTRLHCGERHG